VYERQRAFIADDGTDLGKGAYYASIGFEAGASPPSAWLGLDTFDNQTLAGTALKRITSLEYYAYNGHIRLAEKARFPHSSSLFLVALLWLLHPCT